LPPLGHAAYSRREDRLRVLLAEDHATMVPDLPRPAQLISVRMKIIEAFGTNR
jgi:hypothetical protein